MRIAYQPNQFRRAQARLPVRQDAPTGVAAVVAGTGATGAVCGRVPDERGFGGDDRGHSLVSREVGHRPSGAALVVLIDGP